MFWFGNEQRIQNVGMEIAEKRNGQQRRRGTFQTTPTAIYGLCVLILNYLLSCHL